MDAKESQALWEKVEEIGNSIIQCPMECPGMRNIPSENYYPRGFFLESNNSKADVVVVGLNPGKAGSLTREFYKFAAEKNLERKGVKKATYDDSVRISRAISEDHKYYERPRSLLKKLGMSPTNILWAEIAFCEKDDCCTGRQFKNALDTCSKQYLVSILRLLGEGVHVVCLGRRAYDRIYKLIHVDDEWKNEWKDAQLKILGVYHPTGSRLFGRYFKGKRKMAERRLQETIIKDFERLEHSHGYSRFLPERTRRRTKTKIR
jgi:uracil-DNA glycosylase